MSGQQPPKSLLENSKEAPDTKPMSRITKYHTDSTGSSKASGFAVCENPTIF